MARESGCSRDFVRERLFKQPGEDAVLDRARSAVVGIERRYLQHGAARAHHGRAPPAQSSASRMSMVPHEVPSGSGSSMRRWHWLLETNDGAAYARPPRTKTSGSPSREESHAGRGDSAVASGCSTPWAVSNPPPIS